MQPIRISCLLIFICLSHLTCKKDLEEQLPQLYITVLDSDKEPVVGASVKLYLLQDDFQMDTNVIKNAITGNQGTVLFTELEEKDYFFYVEWEGKNNFFGIASTSKPLEKGKIAKIETFIE